MLKLSSEQREIVDTGIDVPIQVLASAGSGKTRVLTERIRFILESTKKDCIIAVTFTNKAADEIKERLYDIDDLEGRCWIATIHSVAQKILEQYGHTIGLPSDLHIFERDQDRKEVFIQSLRNEKINIDAYLSIEDSSKQKQREKAIRKLLDVFSSIKRNLLFENEIIIKYGDKTFKYYQAYQKALLEAQGIDYDDILFYAQRVLFEQPWCADIYRAKYKHLLVDEAQDLNKAQYEFLRIICGEKITSIMMVGDPNQMIYGFNGSSAKYLTNSFVSDFKPKQHELTENYRSSSAVVKTANKLKPGSHNMENLVLEGKFETISCLDEQEEATWICDKIQSFIGLTNDEIEGTISYSNIVIIARNRFVFSVLEEELAKRAFPFSIKKGERSVEAETILGKALDYGIRYKINPKDWVDGKKLCHALSIPAPKVWTNNSQLLQFSENLHGSESGIIRTLLTLIDSLDSNNPKIPKLCDTMIQSLNHELSGIIDEEERERSVQEINSFKSLWVNFKAKNLGNSLSSFRNSLSLGQLFDEPFNNGLLLSTVHTMKGLESDIVFLMGMCEGVFPDYRAKSEKLIDEELNNMYVAVTRAKRWLFVTYPKNRMMPWGDKKEQKPSRFVQMIDHE